MSRVCCYSYFTFTGVQRFLDARYQRGSWMPGAGQIPKFSSFVLQKLSIFRNVFKNISNRLPKFLTTSFWSFTHISEFCKKKFPTLSPKISDELGRWMPQ